MENNTAKAAPPATFEVEVGIEQFLELLEMRESSEAPKAAYEIEERSAVRRAVFIVRLYDSKNTSMGVPSVKRYVTASFAYGRDLVASTRITSVGIEFPDAPNTLRNGDSPQKRQEAAYEEMHSTIAGRIAERGFKVPLLEGHLTHSKSGTAPAASS